MLARLLKMSEHADDIPATAEPVPMTPADVVRAALDAITIPRSLRAAIEKLAAVRQRKADLAEQRRAMSRQVNSEAAGADVRAASAKLSAQIDALDPQIADARRAMIAEREWWAPVLVAAVAPHREEAAAKAVAALDQLAEAVEVLRVTDVFVTRQAIEVHPPVDLAALDLTYLRSQLARVAGVAQ